LPHFPGGGFVQSGALTGDVPTCLPLAGTRRKRRIDDVELDRGRVKKVKSKDLSTSKSPYAQVARHSTGPPAGKGRR
jgi:hypothetical protein